MSALFSAIVALIGAIPYMVKATNMFIDMWMEYQLGNVKDAVNAEKKKLLYLKRRIREAQSDEERIALSIILNDYRSGKV